MLALREELCGRAILQPAGSLWVQSRFVRTQNPEYLAEVLSHRLTAEALKRIEKSGLSRRELARRLRTSLPQLYRLLDLTNTRKSLSVTKTPR